MTRTSRNCPRLVPSRGFDSPFGLQRKGSDFATNTAASALFTICLLFRAKATFCGFSASHNHNHDPLASVERTHSRHANMKPRHDDRPAVIGRQQRRWLLCHDSTPVAAGPPPPFRVLGRLLHRLPCFFASCAVHVVGLLSGHGDLAYSPR